MPRHTNFLIQNILSPDLAWIHSRFPMSLSTKNGHSYTSRRTKRKLMSIHLNLPLIPDWGHYQKHVKLILKNIPTANFIQNQTIWNTQTLITLVPCYAITKHFLDDQRWSDQNFLRTNQLLSAQVYPHLNNRLRHHKRAYDMWIHNQLPIWKSKSWQLLAINWNYNAYIPQRLFDT